MIACVCVCVCVICVYVCECVSECVLDISSKAAFDAIWGVSGKGRVGEGGRGREGKTWKIYVYITMVEKMPHTHTHTHQWGCQVGRWVCPVLMERGWSEGGGRRGRSVR